MQWEEVFVNPQNTTRLDRMAVPGGWLLKDMTMAQTQADGKNFADVKVTMFMVEDKNHSWDLKLKKPKRGV